MTIIEPSTSEEDAQAIVELRAGQPGDYQVRETDSGRGFRYFVRVEAKTPDPMKHLHAALAVLPMAAEARLGSVFLVGEAATTHVPGHLAGGLLQERDRRDIVLADDFRQRVGSTWQSMVYRDRAMPGGDGRLLAVRLLRPSIHDMEDEDLDGFAIAAGRLVGNDARPDIGAVLLVAHHDHSRLPMTYFFNDLEARIRNQDARPARALIAPPTVSRPPPTIPLGGFPAPRLEPEVLETIGRRIESVVPVIEIEDEVDAIR